MDGFLDADCVTEALFNKGVLTRKPWKLNKAKINSYDIIFELADSARIMGFTIYIKEARHCIGLTALVNQSRQFHIPVDDIMIKCAVKDKAEQNS
jgi:hypothetical protein